ncbi:MAG: ATP-binding protein [Planctomycetota bacterium]|nr:ATP-binding protein [Planctomycetota bacterium]
MTPRTDDVQTQLEQTSLELAASEARFHSLGTNSPDGVVVVDAAGLIRYVNPVTESLFGRAKTELVGQSFGFPVLADETFEVDILRPGLPPTAAEMRVVETKWEGEPVLLASLRDITDRKRAERELERYAAELGRSNEELQQFSYVVSHDLKSPLRTVAGFCKILQEDCEGQLGEQADEHLQHILQGVGRMQRIIDDLLEYSRVRKGDKPAKPVDLAQIFDQAVSNLQADIQEGEAVVTCDKLPTLTANRSQMLRLFQNLMGNAVKFRGQQPPEVHVSAKQERDGWLFSVRDNGIGLDGNQLERIFEVFTRLHPAHEYCGTGIGLSICKKIVELHGGRIWVESEPGKGSVFYFTISNSADTNE